MNKQFYLFDLDGTLTDSKEGIVNAMHYALLQYGIHTDNLDELDKFVGPPFFDVLMEYYGFDEKTAREAIKPFRQYFSETGIYENKLYDGAVDMLDCLVKKGKTLCLATSKPIIYAERILRHFNLMEYFSFVAGSELDGTRRRKIDVINYALKGINATDKDTCIMIGDRMYDITGAKDAGLESVGVLYGYGSREELEGEGATYIEETVASLRGLLERLA